MRAIIVTKTNTIVEGELCFAGQTIMTVSVNELPAYKAQAIVMEGGWITQMCNYVKVELPTRAIDAYEFFDK